MAVASYTATSVIVKIFHDIPDSDALAWVIITMMLGWLVFYCISTLVG